MASIKTIDEPFKYYQTAKDIFHNNAEEYFNNLIKESSTNVEANKSTCDSYYNKLNEIEKEKKAARKKNSFKSFLKFLMILCFILIILIPVGLLIRSHIKNKVDNEIKELEEKINKLTKEADEFKAEAIKQTSLYNSMLDWNIPASLFTKTLPIVEMDKTFDNHRLHTLIDRHDFKEHKSNNVSTIFVQSGAINGNPFLIEKNYVQEMRPYVYTGTLLITWTTYERDSQGHSHAVHHSQTLIAHVSKPKPEYYLDTWLVYGNEAAPKLKFSRSPIDRKEMSQKELEKFANKVDRKLSKVSEKDISFTRLSNAKFEGLFNALDRNDEVGFRLLFTPLAQQNFVELLNSDQYYGDDFFFIKENEINYIKSAHSQNKDYSGNPILFMNFDISKAKETFISYCDDYFKSVYFDLAPILSIPIYQNLKSQEYIYKDNAKERYTSFEVESLANAYDRNIFRPTGCVTDVILKSNFVKREKDYDYMNITAYGFKSISHLDMVPTLGGDGHMHMVPVTWYEYIPLNKTTPFMVSSTDKNRYNFNKESNIFNKMNASNVYYQKGLISALTNINK